MKPLLQKTTLPFMIYISIIFVISIPVYYIVVDNIWKGELDEHNDIIAKKTLRGLTKLNLSADELAQSILLWNDIQPGTKLEPSHSVDAKADSVYTIYRTSEFEGEVSEDRFRCLQRTIIINDQAFTLTVETNIEETDETVVAISLISICFFLLIAFGLIILNRRLSKQIWHPFQDTLSKLKTFNINQQSQIDFMKSDIREFEELNSDIARLLERNVSTYKTQKEFTENASHELQTPLAILKNKLDVLLQSTDLSTDQYDIVEEMNHTLNRSARINKNLLLLAKIENNQFAYNPCSFDGLLRQRIEVLYEYIEQKKLVLHTSISPDIHVQANEILIDLLCNNLLLNAIRHTNTNGEIGVKLHNMGFTVSNSGSSTLELQGLFKRFRKTSGKTAGSGLGLAIVYEICKFHQWTVYYKFEKGMHEFVVEF
ncbi:HAMP domain-containing histidine kinase [Sphingobacterium sp. lm-10]|uniref:sensor histidine kinase n=1 Tax=Sphingobacterium sp. lm-10 TaxID=2944904 RepID=UPI002021C74A|nr:HAMP domain-containing sensor histidine kinase [Sphingobacterium sp. lm-10]MCL7989070.1 HAMP domain-containing histidine kinase [Sphingobacterium sp. lm-10]